MQNTLKIDRAIRGITQVSLAQKVNVSRQTINAIENGKMIPSTTLALKLSIVFEKNVNDMFFLEEKDI
ncbi:MAG: helix-turn-helix transcriptional regulator [Bacteroidales bacterium]